MASRSEENLSCPVCHEIFQEPVILSCSHSFCKACIQTWWTENTSLECPVCKRRSSHSAPPLNLALKNLCEDFLKKKTEQLSTGTEAVCSLHSEKLKLFCLDDQQPVCVICLHSNTHNNHCIRPVNEEAQECREVLQALLKPSQEKLELLNGMKVNFDQTAQNIEDQAQDTERQIKDTFLMLQKLLQEEEQKRIDAVREEKNQKIQVMKSKSEALSREIAALSDTVRATEEVLRAEDLSFLQNYKTATEITQNSQVEVPQLIPEGLIDVTKYPNNLPYSILDSVKEKVTSTPLRLKTVVPEPTVESSEDLVGKLRTLLSQPPISTQATQASTSTQASQPCTSTQATQPCTSTRASQSCTSTRASQPCTPTQASQPCTSTQATQASTFTWASQPCTSTQASQPCTPTQASQPCTPTQASQPHTFTWASQPDMSTLASQPHTSTQASQPYTFTQARKPGLFTRASQPHTSILADQAHTFTQARKPGLFTRASQPYTFTQARKPGLFTRASQPHTSTQASQPYTFTQARKPGLFTQASQPRTFNKP